MTILLLALALLCVVAPFATAARYGRVALVSPLHIVGYLALFGMLLKTAYMALGGEMVFQEYGIPETTVLSAYAFITYFVLFICLGYLLAARRRSVDAGWSAARASVLQVRNPKLLAILSAGVAALVMSVILANRGLGSIEDAVALETIHALNSSKIVRIEGVEGYGESYAGLKIFLVIPSLALAVFVARFMLWRRKFDLLAMLIFLGLNVLLVFFKGSRFDLLYVLGTFVVVHMLLGGRVSAALIRNCIAGGLMVMLLYVAMTTLRAQKDISEDVSFDTAKAAEQIFGSTYFLDLNVPIMILEHHGANHLFWGESYLGWTYAWVPRALWPDKPAVTLGPYVKQEIFGITGTIGGVNPTGPGEAYLNFGWLGVCIGAGLGWLYRRLEDATLSVRGLTRRGGVWLYSVAIVPLVVGTLQSSFSSTVLSAAVEAGLIWIVLAMTRLRVSTGRRPTVARERTGAPQ